MNPSAFIHAWSNGPWVGLADVFRYSTLQVHHRESVAEHSYYVGLFSYALALELRKNDEEIDMEKLLRRCLLHDVDEAVLGDVIRPVKYRHKDLHAALQLSAAIEMTELDDTVEGRQIIFNDWIEAKDSSVEGNILHLADGWSCVTYCLREIKLGNLNALLVLERDIYQFIKLHRWHQVVLPYATALLQLVKDIVAENQK